MSLHSHFYSFASELARMRIQSHRSPRLLQQIRLAIRHRLTYRLYSLSSEIGAIRLRVEVRFGSTVMSLPVYKLSQLAMDEQRLAFPHNVVLTPAPLHTSGMQLTRYCMAFVGFSLSILFLRYYQCDDPRYFTNPSTTGSQELNSHCHWIHFLGLLIFAKLSITKGYLPEHCLLLETSRTVSLSSLHSCLSAILITPYSLLRFWRRFYTSFFFFFGFFFCVIYYLPPSISSLAALYCKLYHFIVAKDR